MVQRCFKKLKIESLYDPKIPRLGIYAQKNWNRYLHTHVHSPVHNMQEVEATVKRLSPRVAKSRTWLSNFTFASLSFKAVWYSSVEQITLCSFIHECTVAWGFFATPSSFHGILQARVLEWVAISFSRGFSRPRDRTQVSRIAGRRFNLWATREAQGRNCCHMLQHDELWAHYVKKPVTKKHVSTSMRHLK